MIPFLDLKSPWLGMEEESWFCASAWRVTASMMWIRQTLSFSLPRSLLSFNGMSAYTKTVLLYTPIQQSLLFELVLPWDVYCPSEHTHIPPSVLTNALPSGTAWEQGVNMHFCVGVILSTFPTLSLLTLMIGVFKHLHTLLCFSHLQPTWRFLLCFVSYGVIGDGGFPSTQCLFLI